MKKLLCTFTRYWRGGDLLFAKKFDDANFHEQVLTFIIDQVAKMTKVPKTEITPYTTLDELGVDSLDACDLIASWEQSFGGRLEKYVTRGMSMNALAHFFIKHTLKK